MSHYTPRPNSLAGRVVAELAERPRVLTSSEISKMFDVPSASVGASLKIAVQHGVIMLRLIGAGARPRCEYYPPHFDPPASTLPAAEPRAKAQPLDITMYDDGEVHVRGHLIGVDEDGLAVFSAKQLAYLVARVCTPVVEVSP